jgi:alpha-tubulin suppressor-like RCC1 family protein
MEHIACSPRRFIPRPALMLVVGLGFSLGCSHDTESPTEPETAPLLASTSTAALAFSQVSGGTRHTCGLTLDQRLYCWGIGYLGDGTNNWSPTPVAVATTLRFRQVSAAWFHTCAVTTDYRAYCWGNNQDGSLGDGTQTDRLKPVPVAGGLRFRQIDGGEVHTCAVTYPDNRAYCWGYGGDGELGIGTPRSAWQLTPAAVAGGLQFRQVSAGGGRSPDPPGAHSCGVTISNEAYCWGDNRVGQLGIGGTTGGYNMTPTRVAGAHPFHQIEAGVDYTCAVTTDNRAFCWGNGRQGQIGDGKTYLRFSPSAVAGGHSFERVTTGLFHTCAETTLNRAYCWGLNRGDATGALGDGTTTQRLTPVAVAGGIFFSQVSAGYSHTCGRADAGVAYCWGTNSSGQLGDGTTTTRLRPVRVVGPR